MSILTKKCKTCKKEFFSILPTKEYCSERCRNTYKTRGKRRRFVEKLKQIGEYADWRNKESERAKKYYKEIRCKFCGSTVGKRRKLCETCRKEQARLRDIRMKSIRRGLPSTLTLVEWNQAILYFDNKCAYCYSSQTLQKEHFIPARLGGGFTKNNIIPSCQKCNLDKLAKDPFKWLAEKENGTMVLERIMNYFDSL